MRGVKKRSLCGIFCLYQLQNTFDGLYRLWVADSPMMERGDPRDPSVKLSTRAALAIVLITAAVILCILMVNP